MTAITISGTAKALDGTLLPNATFVLQRAPLALVPDGATFYVSEPKIVVSNGAALVSFAIEPGNYIGRVMTAAAVEIAFAFNVATSPGAQTFSECLVASPVEIFDAVQLALQAATGLPFYGLRIDAQNDTDLPVDSYFLAPNGTQGLAVWEKFYSIGVGGLSTRFIGQMYPSAFFPAGTVAAPGLPVDGDTDTGLYSPAANQLAAAVGGAMAWLASATGLQVPGLITGTAVTQTRQDTTAGRLLKVGDFGLGGGASAAFPPETVLASIDATTIPSGFYQTINTTTGTFPAGESLFGQLITMRYDSLNFTQMWMSALTDTVYTRRYRSTDAPAFSPWRPLFSRHNLLGTVAQTAGVPTGAVIQRGTNANGEFVRFADGTLICTHSLAASAGGAVTWTYPSAFIAAPVVTGNAQATVLAAVCLDAAPGTTTASLSVRDKTDARRADTMRLQAVGRWF